MSTVTRKLASIQMVNAVEPIPGADAIELFGYQESEAYMSECGIKTVHLADVITLNHSIDELVELSQGESWLREGVQREGIVIRPEQEEYDRDIGRLSFKAINPKFLLKHGE